jgi:hypothetical protein
VRERLVFEVADGQLDDRVLAVLGLDRKQLVAAVGDKRKQLPTGQQLALAIQRADTADDQAPAAERGLGDLRDRAVGVVGERLPGGLRLSGLLCVRPGVTVVGG